jgi:predicted nucleotide-binding protein
LRKEIVIALPQLYEDFPVRPKPDSSGTSDFDGAGYITKDKLALISDDIRHMIDIYSAVSSPESRVLEKPIVFISHGRNEDWRQVQSYIERDIGVRTLELAQEASRGRSILQKLEEESNKCVFAVVVMTGDDRAEDGVARVRENVMHEIGFFQGKYGIENVCILYEEGTSIPSNIHGLVYVPYPKGVVKATFGELSRELKAAFQL